MRPVRREGPGTCEARARARGGGHSVLMTVPPGTGKTMLASRLPAFCAHDRGRSTRVGGSALARQRGLRSIDVRQAPVSRAASHAPQSRSSAAAAIRARGRSRSRCTACCFSTSCRSSTARCWKCCASRWSRGTSAFPARRGRRIFPRSFQLDAAMNPCPCGYLGHNTGRCRCTPTKCCAIGARYPAPCSTASTSTSKCRPWVPRT